MNTEYEYIDYDERHVNDSVGYVVMRKNGDVITVLNPRINGCKAELERENKKEGERIRYIKSVM